MFTPEYEGDTPNRQWVRRKLEEKGFQIGHPHVTLRMSEACVKHLFDFIIASNAHVPAIAEGN